jgi:hypothetical protein
MTGNPVKMGIRVAADGRGCNDSTGWLAVDEVVYDTLGLKRLSLRTMQICDNRDPPVFVAFRWTRP